MHRCLLLFGEGMIVRTVQPVIFVDDSPKQIASAAKHAPEVARLHLIGCEMIKPIVGKSDDATHHPHDWSEAEATIRDYLA